MPTQALTPATLKAELSTDPLGLGYAVPWASGGDADLAALLNAGADGSGGGPSGATVPRATVDTGTALSYVQLADWDALSPSHQQYLAALAATPGLQLVDPLGGGASQELSNLLAIFPATTPTGQTLLGLRDRPCSRAEQLFGADTRITPQQVAEARTAV